MRIVGSVYREGFGGNEIVWQGGKNGPVVSIFKVSAKRGEDDEKTGPDFAKASWRPELVEGSPKF
jgi:hypothetical protein